MKTMRSRLLMIGLVLTCIGLSQLAISQSSKPPLKPTGSAAPQVKTADFLAERAHLSARAKQALADESGRERAKICDSALSTVAAVNCLGKEDDATEINYKALSNSIRAMLDLVAGEEESPSFGPTGQPLTAAQQVADFDSLETEWQKYRLKAAQTGYNQFKGGTEAAVFRVLTDLAILRSHMLELAFIYDFLLGNH